MTAEVIVRAVSFSVLVEISSWPLDLVVSRVESISNTSSSVHINGCGSQFGSVDGKSVDSNTGVECFFYFFYFLFITILHICTDTIIANC